MKRGFTILELLVVIVIIGIIASLTFVALNGVRVKARDTKRISDIRQIQSALEIYKNDNGVYPTYATSGLPLVANGQTYMAKVPVAPGTPDGTCTSDTYTYSTTDQTNYTIDFCLGGAVNSAGPEACIAKPGNPCYVFQCGDTKTYLGDTYNTVLIGSQCWFKENLKYLPSVSAPGSSSNSAPYYYVHGYSGTVVSTAKATTNYTTYGALYNWSAANTGSLCPSGWHIPTHAEWGALKSYLIVSGQGGAGIESATKLKASSVLWTPNSGTNTTGFSALPAGLRYINNTFGYMNTDAYFWTSTVYDSTRGYYWQFMAPYTYIDGGGMDKMAGLSVRCLKN